jgi:lysozyme family protein
VPQLIDIDQKDSGQTLKVSADGKVGQQTLDALAAAANPQDVRKAVLGERLKTTADIVVSKPSQLKFLQGWINRSISLLDFV